MPISIAEISASIMALIAGLLILIIGAILYQKWKEKKQTPTLFLTISIFAWVGACWSAMGIYTLAEFATEIAIVLQKCVYSFVLLGGMMMFLFGTPTFYHFKSKIWTYLYVILGCAFIILVWMMDSVDVRYFPGYDTYPLLSIKIEYSIFLVLYLVPLLIGIPILALRTSRRINERLYSVGYRFIAYGTLDILAVFVVDALSTVAQGMNLIYAILLNLTWIFPLIAAFFCYIGWTLPNWFRSIIKKN
ncbi:MAG: hypothetical protein RBG13Loki_3655 [Promethearchaeota archaeon CR_4]|nr:MAG: hypothetical protein RBG13Loki_3655 [Candidatus Lokiarchaeota archaeon CR_4]